MRSGMRDEEWDEECIETHRWEKHFIVYSILSIPSVRLWVECHYALGEKRQLETV
jgi:hypothetical protein